MYQDPPGVDEFFYKIRIWHEEVTPKHKNMFRVFWMTDDRNNEYDIPPCSDESGPVMS